MKKSPELDPLRERPELDFSKGVRGKHYARAMEGRTTVVLAPDLTETFPDSDSLNDALRSLKAIVDRTQKRA